jgi:hypothetical protein
MDKELKESSKYIINRYADRIELFDNVTYDFVVSIHKQFIIDNYWIMKLIC